MAETAPHPDRSLALGIALLAGASLLFELLLTRLFSVILWYHFAMAVISLALLGIGAGGVWLYVRQRAHPPERLHSQMAWCALGFALAAPIGTLLMIQVTPEAHHSHGVALTGAGIAALALQLLAAAVPFFFVGLAIGLALTHRTAIAGRLYAADLAGAGLGCIGIVALLGALDLGGAVLVIGLLGLVAALVFARHPSVSRRVIPSVGAALLLLVIFLATHLAFPWFTVRVTKAGPEPDREWESWNAFSRIAVFPKPRDRAEIGLPTGWGISRNWRGPAPREKWLFIDAAAMTPITEWDGSDAALQRFSYLDWDVTALGHHLRPRGRCLVVGAGGGRDMLTALRFDQREIQAVEINPAIREALTGPYRDFSGGIYEHPRVDVALDEARSWLERSRAEFDLLQISMIDTWAATAAGAFVFSEAHLYTVEAFETFHDRLAPGGLLCISRWFNAEPAGETLRLQALAMEAWRRAGTQRPELHMAIIANDPTRGVGTLVMGRDPLTESDIAALRRLCERMDFTPLWLPDGEVIDSPFAELALAGDPQPFIDAYRFNIAPPTDDQPFFFHMLRPGHVLGILLGLQESESGAFSIQANYRAVLVLLTLAALVTAFALLFIMAPLAFARRADLAACRGAWRWRLIGYFACLGVGFMFVEIPMIQRLNLFLGHPIYAFAVVLATLLVAGGLGSFTVQRIVPGEAASALRRRLPLLIALALLVAWLQPPLLRAGLAWPTWLRITVAVVQLIPLGLLLGMPLPLGLQLAQRHMPRLIPWLWGVNGALSVVGSVGALCLGLILGFPQVMVLGAIVYGLALLLTFGGKGRFDVDAPAPGA